MAEFRKIVPSNPISNFRNYQPSGGTAFGFLANAMETGYNMLLPAATEKMKTSGAEAGYEMARRNIGTEQATGPVSRISAKTPEGFDWKNYSIGGATRPDGISGLKPEMQGALASMFSAADQELGPGLQIHSGYRSPQRQAEIIAGNMGKHGLGGRVSEWNADVAAMGPEAAGSKWRQTFRSAGLTKWVGMPGGSRHQHGDAADLSFNGKSLGRADPKVAAWVRENSARFGLHVPMSWEPWEVRLRGSALSAKGSPSGGEGEPVPGETSSVMVTNADGKTEPRLFSPLSGPLLQIHNAAAQAAYLSEVENQAVMQMMEMSTQFAGNPQAFEQAMDGFISEAVKAAPQQFRGELRGKMSNLAQRRILGMHEEVQRETRQRASNSNSALIERYGDELTNALASGDEQATEAARSQLDEALRLRETLPGLAWTPEQSFNTVVRAEQRAEAVQAKAQRDAATSAKGLLRSILKAAKENMTHADEGMLLDPAMQAADPDLWREVAAWTMLRDTRPEIFGMTPDELAAAVAAERAKPIDSEFQIDIIKALEDMAQTQAKAFRDDPVARAQEVLPGMYSGLDMQTPEAFGESMGDRIKSALTLAGIDENGDRTLPAYVNGIALLSKAEQEQVAQIFGPEVDPATRLAYTSAVVRALGADTPEFFRQAKVDSVLAMGAMLQANGGDEALAAQALRGQEMLANNLVMLPSKAATLGQISPDIQGAVSHTPPADQKMVLDFAKAIYASQAQGVDPNSDEAKALMADSIQKALGQSGNWRGELTGGVQRVGGSKGIYALLPVGASASEATEAILAGLGAASRSTSGAMRAIGSRTPRMDADEFVLPATPADLWIKAGAPSAPLSGGKPLRPDLFTQGKVRLVPDPEAKNFYFMMIDNAGSISDVRDAFGDAFTFNLVALIEATR